MCGQIGYRMNNFSYYNAEINICAYIILVSFESEKGGYLICIFMFYMHNPHHIKE